MISKILYKLSCNCFHSHKIFTSLPCFGFPLQLTVVGFCPLSRLINTIVLEIIFSDLKQALCVMFLFEIKCSTSRLLTSNIPSEAGRLWTAHLMATTSPDCIRKTVFVIVKLATNETGSIRNKNMKRISSCSSRF